MEIFTYISYVVTVLVLLNFTRLIFNWLRKRYGRTMDEEELNRITTLKGEIENRVFSREWQQGSKEVIVRNAARTGDYMQSDEPCSSFRMSNWFKAELRGLYYGGIEVYVSMPIYLKPNPSMDSWRPASRDDEEAREAIKAGRIPFRFIVSVDWTGDEYNDVPHIYCRYRGLFAMPYEDFRYYMRSSSGKFLYPLDNFRPWNEDRRIWRRLWLWIRVLVNR